MRALSLLSLILFSLLSGCTSYLPSTVIPAPSPAQPYVKVVTIPLPVIATSPNEGVTYGALTAFLLHNDKDEVSYLFAPQVNRNENFGTTGTLYGALYPSPVRSIEFNLSKSSKVNSDYEVRLRDQSLMERQLEVNAFLYNFTDGSARFFGFGPDSSADNETNFADREFGYTVSAGYPLRNNTVLFLGDRLRRVEVDEGAVKRLPNLQQRFSTADVPGIDGFSTHAQSVSLVYSTLDAAAMASSGVRARATVEGSLAALGSSARFVRYEAEVKGFFPVPDSRFISAGRFAFGQVSGGSIPFLEQSILGGENTLRGYGKNRFIENSYVLCNLEERIRLFRWEVFDVKADWELAPFIDIGGVMDSLGDFKAGELKVNPGIGFRAVVRPNILGRIDVGWGKDGAAVFVGLGYPF
ncbi:outer membrane protein assembly factor [Geomonas oryzisoli]|uniref:Outer membrane protein assembly factor n=2 Tax=Geomonas oryzisoli TaxID=2847992 RepID=A0ABX8JF86_9BACT|nr:outer membrane protein assembly factor [Geomonas oryzisoli]